MNQWVVSRGDKAFWKGKCRTSTQNEYPICLSFALIWWWLSLISAWLRLSRACCFSYRFLEVWWESLQWDLAPSNSLQEVTILLCSTFSNGTLGCMNHNSINDVPAEDSEDISLDLDQTSGPSLQSAALTYYMWSVTNTVSLLLFSLSLDRTFALRSQKIKKICKGLKSQLCLSLKGINTCLIQWHHFFWAVLTIRRVPPVSYF